MEELLDTYEIAVVTPPTNNTGSNTVASYSRPNSYNMYINSNTRLLTMIVIYPSTTSANKAFSINASNLPTIKSVSEYFA